MGQATKIEAMRTEASTAEDVGWALGVLLRALVQRHPNPADRRRRQIVATARGRRAIATLCDQVVHVEHAVLGTLDADERELFRHLLDKAACGEGKVEHSADACVTVTAAFARSSKITPPSR